MYSLVLMMSASVASAPAPVVVSTSCAGSKANVVVVASAGCSGVQSARHALGARILARGSCHGGTTLVLPQTVQVAPAAKPMPKAGGPVVVLAPPVLVQTNEPPIFPVANAVAKNTAVRVRGFFSRTIAMAKAMRVLRVFRLRSCP